MKVQLRNVLYDVNWERIPNKRADGTIRQSHNGLDRIDTVCNVSLIHEDKVRAEKYQKILSGVAVQNSSDVFSKAIGRKVALTRAIRNYFNKQQRTIFWDIYKQKCKLR